MTIILFSMIFFFFFFNDTATTEIYTLSLHDALPISQHPGGLERYAGRAQAEASADRGDQPSDHRMQMEMLVRVAMIEGEAGVAKSLELCGDLGGELAARVPVEAQEGAEGRHIGTKHAAPIHQMSHRKGRKHRPALDRKSTRLNSSHLVISY